MVGRDFDAASPTVRNPMLDADPDIPVTAPAEVWKSQCVESR
ncbi:hypothetical protein QEN40_01695 [Gordonia alkanivorans]|jgi:hypothetical protein|uniref:Uncharacterized protein n=1 Tax=Gordonia alkanivorans CGMCC 6845 TaxID=1423140 RepID=W9DK15_9ACTN|nr:MULTISPECIES: hypothetical protein [Gordonia]ETA08984.1 hypothetical protein V525_00485 [Gordonia alkanivorans CGMCC 6845]MDH3022906.1 hypothetical protein [Gordonia alkanivorans]MDH3039695.1 hypothetical protein [Gordonia alkanivorans]MDH3050486.1 hypothetical protein [Gordonia alkanivorans]